MSIRPTTPPTSNPLTSTNGIGPGNDIDFRPDLPTGNTGTQDVLIIQQEEKGFTCLDIFLALGYFGLYKLPRSIIEKTVISPCKFIYEKVKNSNLSEGGSQIKKEEPAEPKNDGDQSTESQLLAKGNSSTPSNEDVVSNIVPNVEALTFISEGPKLDLPVPFSSKGETSDGGESNGTESVRSESPIEANASDFEEAEVGEDSSLKLYLELRPLVPHYVETMLEEIDSSKLAENEKPVVQALILAVWSQCNTESAEKNRETSFYQRIGSRVILKSNELCETLKKALDTYESTPTQSIRLEKIALEIQGRPLVARKK